MRLSKQQMKIMDVLRNGGHLWMACGMPYLARKDGQGRLTSERLNNKTFTALKTNGLIEPDDRGCWVTKFSNHERNKDDGERTEV